MGVLRSLSLFLILLALCSCATYARRIQEPRSLYEHGRFDEALARLTPLAEAKDNDELLYLLDMGIVQHAAGRYADAIQTFLKADKLAEISDYTSLTQEVGTVLLSDEIKAYQGENFEKVLIHVYLAVDFTLLGKMESALVECRRVNRMIEQMISEGKLPYEHNRFAKYLSAALFESQGDHNSAFVDYRQLRRWNSGTPYLAIGLLRMAERLQAVQELSQFRKEYPQAGDYRLKKNEGEVILLAEVGKGPFKVPRLDFRLLPRFQKRVFYTDHLVLSEPASQKTCRSETLFDLETTAIADLEHRIGLIMAKKMAGVVAKEATAAIIAKQTKSELAGALTSLFLHATDTADLRSWSLLPARFQMARLKLPAGRHTLRLDMVSNSGNVSTAKQWENIEVLPGRIQFLHFRTSD